MWEKLSNKIYYSNYLAVEETQVLSKDLSVRLNKYMVKNKLTTVEYAIVPIINCIARILAI